MPLQSHSKNLKDHIDDGIEIKHEIPVDLLVELYTLLTHYNIACIEGVNQIDALWSCQDRLDKVKDIIDLLIQKIVERRGKSSANTKSLIAAGTVATATLYGAPVSAAFFAAATVSDLKTDKYDKAIKWLREMDGMLKKLRVDVNSYLRTSENRT